MGPAICAIQSSANAGPAQSLLTGSDLGPVSAGSSPRVADMLKIMD